MYVEQKTDGNRWLNDRGPAEVGKVTFSQTGKTVYFNGKSFLRATDCGGGGNYLCIETGDSYWISGVKKRRSNRHWAGGGPIVDRTAKVQSTLPTSNR
jgi:hypothetical protein